MLKIQTSENVLELSFETFKGSDIRLERDNPRGGWHVLKKLVEVEHHVKDRAVMKVKDTTWHKIDFIPDIHTREVMTNERKRHGL